MMIGVPDKFVISLEKRRVLSPINKPFNFIRKSITENEACLGILQGSFRMTYVSKQLALTACRINLASLKKRPKNI